MWGHKPGRFSVEAPRALTGRGLPIVGSLLWMLPESIVKWLRRRARRPSTLLVAVFLAAVARGPAPSALVTAYSLNVRIRVKPERRTEFLECIRANQQGTLSTEPLALEYLFGEDETVKNTFHFHEQYRGREGFEAHTGSPHFAAWRAFADTDPFTEPPEAVFFIERGAPRERTPTSSGRGRYCLNVQMGIRPERRDDFLICAGANRRGTLDTESLALAYLFGEDENKPNTFHFHEQYEGREGFEAHTRTPHFAEWEAFAATKPFSQPPEVSFFVA